MALIVEDGTGIINADTWASMAEANSYATKVGNTAWVDGDNEFKEPAMRRGLRYLDAVYGSRYAGLRTYGPTEQALSWPRKAVVWDDGYLLPQNEIPVELKRAQIEAAFLEFAAPNSTMPSAATQSQSSVTVGPISVTYREGASRVSLIGTPLYSTIDGLMIPLLDQAKAGSVAFLKRA